MPRAVTTSTITCPDPVPSRQSIRYEMDRADQPFLDFCCETPVVARRRPQLDCFKLVIAQPTDVRIIVDPLGEDLSESWRDDEPGDGDVRRHLTALSTPGCPHRSATLDSRIRRSSPPRGRGAAACCRT